MTFFDVKHCVECLQPDNNTLTCFTTSWMGWTERAPQTCLGETKARDLIEACQYRVPFVTNNVRRFWKTTEQRRVWIEKKATWNCYCIFTNGLALKSSKIFFYFRHNLQDLFYTMCVQFVPIFQTKLYKFPYIFNLGFNGLGVLLWQETSALD